MRRFGVWKLMVLKLGNGGRGGALGNECGLGGHAGFLRGVRRGSSSGRAKAIFYRLLQLVRALYVYLVETYPATDGINFGGRGVFSLG